MNKLLYCCVQAHLFFGRFDTQVEGQKVATQESELLNYLMMNYTPTVRPRLNHLDPVIVKTSVLIEFIVDFSEHDQVSVMDKKDKNQSTFISKKSYIKCKIHPRTFPLKFIAV